MRNFLIALIFIWIGFGLGYKTAQMITPPQDMTVFILVYGVVLGLLIAALVINLLKPSEKKKESKKEKFGSSDQDKVKTSEH